MANRTKTGRVFENIGKIGFLVMVIIFAPVLRLEITQKFYHEEAILSKDFVICLTLGTGVVGGIIGAATLASHPEFGD